MIQTYLEEQKQLSPGGRFSCAGNQFLAPHRPLYDPGLIPISPPGKGQQYAFEVDLDRCTGCKACVTACHSRNGLEEGETWRTAATIHRSEADPAPLQTVTAACHHCIEPACLTGCPVKAYEKDAITGIVRHLDEQCIGCHYCEMRCPYEVPHYSKSKGIVRKCDLCASRLAAGEAPACAQACPSAAIRVVLVDREEARRHAAERFAAIPEAPDPRYTRPTTIYKTTRRPESPATTCNNEPIEAEHPHLSLVFMLVGLQASTGMLLAARFLELLAAAGDSSRGATALVVSATAFALLALAASLGHLGRPCYAFRAVLGVATSWLSREVVALGLYLAFLLLHCLFATRPGLGVTAAALLGMPGGTDLLAATLAWTACGFGVLSVLCSVMVYQSTPRPAWAWPTTAAKFVLTTVIMGLSGALTAETVTGAQPTLILLALAIAATVLGKLSIELASVLQAAPAASRRWREAALAIKGSLRRASYRRLWLALLGIAAFSSATLSGHRGFEEFPILVAGLGCLLLLAGETVERFLFFACAAAPRMPGARRH